ncbi:MAG TPA: DUF6263 family protein [Kofleriaceae bacterium]|nr:DUF6263 family protein [Kofleriaceae bacterium]
MKQGLLMVSALVLSFGCEKAGKDSSQLADDLPANEVHVLGVGADPKVKLRYDVPKDSHVVLDMKARMGMSSPAMPQAMNFNVDASMDETCTDVEPSGDMRFEIKVASVSVDAPGVPSSAADMVKDAMGNMVYRFRMSPSGKIDDVQVDGLTGPMAQMGESMKQSLEQFAAPLPDDAVGKGSTWKFKRTAEANGVKMATLAKFELVDFKDGVATFNVDGRVVAPKQTIEKNGISVELKKMDGTISGTIANDLHRLAPQGNFKMTIDMTMGAMGKSIGMKMTMDSDITAH